MKFIKKSIALLLALLMAFGSLSLVASAGVTGGIYDWEVDTRFYRMQRNADGYIVDADGNVIGDADDNLTEGSTPVWVETTTAKKGEAVKARVFLKTNFALGVGVFLYVYPTAALTHNIDAYEIGPSGKVTVLNKENEDLVNRNWSGFDVVGIGAESIMLDMVYEGYVDESSLEGMGWVATMLDTGKTTKFDGSSWFFEYNFIVNNPTDELPGQVYLHPDCVADYDLFTATTYVTAADEEGISMTDGIASCDDYDYLINYPTLNDQDANSSLGTKATITLNAAGGKFANGSGEMKVESEVAPFSAATGLETPNKAGSIFTGWTATYTDSGKPYVEGLVQTADIKAAHEDITYTANYIASGKTVTVNVNYTDAITGEAKVVSEEYSTTVGNKVVIVNADSAETVEATTNILVKDLPAVEHYEFDAANNSDANLVLDKVLSDSDAVMNVYYKAVDYTATFEPANGEAATTITQAYYSDYNAPAAPVKANSNFLGWKLDGSETVVEAGAALKLEGNVSYTAQYENVYNVTYAYAGEKPDGIEDIPAATTTAGATITVPAVEVPAGYELVWTATGATKNDDGTFTAGANDVTITGTWTKTPYEVTYVYAGDVPADYEAPKAITLTVGDVIAEPEVVVPAGYELVWTMSGDVEGKMGTAPVVMTGTWSKTPYNVAYNYVGDVPADAAEPADTTATVGETITLETPAAEGYTFKGWTVEGADYNAETGVVTVGTTAVTITGTWAKNYTVTYEFVGSGDYADKVPAVDAPKAETVISGDTVVVPENPTADGYNFIEWTVEGAEYDADTDSYIVNGSDVTVTGIWEAIEYKYRYYLDDEKTVLFSTKKYTYGDTPVEVDLPSDEVLAAKGFEGWYADEWDIEAPETVDGDLDFVLLKSQYEYCVEFYNRDDAALEVTVGEDETDTCIFVVHGETVDPSIVVESADVLGYTATGKWHIGDAEGDIAEFPYEVTEDTAFYADYEINKNDIVYYADEEGKTVYETIVNVAYDTVISEDHVPAGTPAKEGYSFVAWTEKVTGLEIADYLGSNMPDENVYVYPSFEINSYTITWVVDGNETTSTQPYGEAIAYKGEAPAKEGYTFKGWATSENGAVINDLGTVPANDNTKFYAIFAGDDHIAYTINKYFMNTNGTYEGVEAVPETAYGIAGEKATYTPAAETGFTFDAAQANVLEGTIAGDGSLELTVYYARDKHTVTYMANDAVVDTAEVYYDVALEASDDYTAAPAGYELLGWSRTEGATAADADLGKMGTADVTLYAVIKAGTSTYTIKTYTMGLDGQYGEADVTTGEGTTDTEVTYTPDTKTGFTTDKASYTVEVKADDSDVIEVYYARDKHNVIYMANGAKVDEAEVYYEAAITGSANYTAPEGYILLGWSVVDGSETADTNLGTMGTADVTLYAVLEAGASTYTIKTYTMGLDGQYGEAVVTTGTGTTDEEATYVAPVVEGFTADKDSYTVVVKADDSDVIEVYYSRNLVDVTINGATSKMYYGAQLDTPVTPAAPEGQSFDKWVDADGNAVTFPVEIGTEDIVINATFKNNAYPVAFVVNGENYAAGDKEFGSAIVAPEDPTVAGYSFLGWSLTEKGEVIDPETMTVPVDGITFYAVFEAQTVNYTVKKFFMNVEGDDWMAPVDETRSAVTDTTVALDFAKEEATGFTIDEANSTKSATIAGDGSTVFVIYYNRDTVEVTVDGITSDMYYQSELTTPATPAAAPGYAHGGWAYANGTPVEFPVEIGTEDIVINSVWNKLSFNLTFKDSKGNVISGPTSTEYDADITAPEVEDKEGYTFIGWIAEVTGEKFNGKMPAKDVVYVETWNDGNYVPYKVETWIMNVDGEYELTTEAYGSALTGNTQGITANAIPGFTVDAEKSVLSAVIVGDGSTVLKAYYARNMYTITFDGENEQQVYFGDALPVVEPAAQTGKTFTGWVVEGTNEKAPATMPANDVALVSTWSDTVYTITYIVEGVVIATDEYIYGADVTAPADPEAYGKKFNRWAPAVPETMPAENLIISAIFDSAIYKVTFVDFDGEAFVEMQVRAGDEIVLPVEQPTKEFYIFKGWLNVPSIMPNEDITIEPDFERMSVVLVPEEGSTTVIDRDNMVIYGLELFLDEALIDEYLAVEGDGYYTVTPVRNGCYGTGTVIEVYDRVTGEKLETFHIVVFGDLNGDARVNAVDSAIANDESLMLTTWSLKEVYENGALVENADYKVYMAMAADVNGKDGRIDATDVSDIRDTSLGTVVINQVTGIVEQ